MDKLQNSHSGKNAEQFKGKSSTNFDKTEFHAPLEVSSEGWDSTPDTAVEMINTYGTYEIQATADTKNEFPAISQGLPSENVKPKPKNFDEGVVPILNNSDQRL